MYSGGGELHGGEGVLSLDPTVALVLLRLLSPLLLEVASADLLSFLGCLGRRGASWCHMGLSRLFLPFWGVLLFGG